MCNGKHNYIGETIKPLGIRAKQHLAAVRNHKKESSALAEHSGEYHQHQPVTFPFRIIRRTRDFVQRKCTEAVAVKRLGPSMNRRMEGHGVMNLHFWSISTWTSISRGCYCAYLRHCLHHSSRRRSGDRNVEQYKVGRCPTFPARIWSLICLYNERNW